MSSDNHRAYVAIPMGMLDTSTGGESDDEGAAVRCRSHCSKRNYLLPKCLGVAAVCIGLLILFITRMAHHHHHYHVYSLHDVYYGWNPMAHDTTTKGKEDVVTWQQQGVETNQQNKVDETWLVDEDGVLINHEDEFGVVFDAPQDHEYFKSMEEEDVDEKVWYAEDEEDASGEERFDAVDEPLEFSTNSQQETNVNVVDNVVEIPGLP